ncbi:MAG: hypothetical protein K2N24_02135, partial [Lachnospiraceae bacterium]|nr:hypothetical protein [Lachnospiraceae bacterium]
LITAYQSLAGREEVKTDSEVHYYEALACCDNVLSQVNKEENPTVYEDILIHKAEIYIMLGMEKEALSEYQAAEALIGNSGQAVYVSHLRYLYNKYKKENPDVSAWDAPDILEVYDAGSQIPGIGDNFEWKALVSSLQPFLNRSPEDTEPVDNNEDAQSHGPAEGETLIDTEEDSGQSTMEED